MAPNVFAPPPQLPHPRIPIEVILVVEEALRVAWSLLRTTTISNFDITTATEDEITQQFRLILCNQVLKNEMVSGFGLKLFRVNREAKYANYAGDNTEKMPDLFVDIIDRPQVERPSDDGLFIECKPVDNRHGTGEHYCDKGLIRFVEGSYAWTMSQAMMIGYVRVGYSIVPKLLKALQERPAMKTIKYPTPCSYVASQALQWCEAIHISYHERSFPYKETGQPAPLITLRHLWLQRD